MTHDELLAKIDEAFPVFDANEPILWSAYKEYLKALRAVVELHKPDIRNGCSGCDYPMPCPTIQAIEKELK